MSHPSPSGPGREYRRPPVQHEVEPTVELARLRAQMHDDAAVDQFVSDFLRLLDGRLDGLRQHLAAGRTDAADVALLSLTAVGGMLGADALCSAAERLRSALATGADTGPLLDHLVAVSAETSRALHAQCTLTDRGEAAVEGSP